MDKDIRDRLKKLGLHLGANHIKSPTQSKEFIPDFLDPKHEFQNSFGCSVKVDQVFNKDYIHGEKACFNDDLGNKEIRIWNQPGSLFKDCVFIDTETTGLSQSTGTFAFMVGVGAILKGQFFLRQYFLRDPGEEQAMLLDLANFIEPFKVLVSYNGVGFDIPILSNRYKLYRLPHLLKQKDHIDLLKYTRKLWRFQYNDRSLKSIEANVLKFHRSDQEIPGWMVPDMYRDYIKTGNAYPMQGVFYHNAIDIVSLSVLLDVVNDIVISSKDYSEQFDTINFALAVSHQKENRHADAIKRYTEALNQTNLNDTIRIKTLENLALLCKKNNAFQKAIPYWMEAVSLGSEIALIELSKYYEHKEKDCSQALKYVDQLIVLIEKDENQFRKKTILLELAHRKNRLQHKIDKGC